jgi:methyl-accepting chemotaxis protein
MTDTQPTITSDVAVDWPYLVSPGVRTALRTIAVVGVVVAIAGTIVVWRFLGDLERNTDRSLLIGEEAATTLVDTVDVADEVVAGLDDGLATLEQTFSALDAVLTSTVDVARSTAILAADLPARLDEIDRAFASLQSIGETVDRTLSALSDIPFGPDYDPDGSFTDAIAEIRASFDPLQANLDAIADELSTFADGSDGLQAELDSLALDVERTRTALDGTDELLDRYRRTAEEARTLAADSRPDLSDSMTSTRWILVLVGLLIAAAQIVPWVLSDLRRLAAEPDRVDEHSVDFDG